MVNLKIWEPVIEINQLEKGSIIKIIGIVDKNSYNRISVKKVIDIGDIEILINKKRNYYFNLTAYLEARPMWGKWVIKLLEIKNLWT